MPYQEKFRKVAIFYLNFITFLDEYFPCEKFYTAKFSRDAIFYQMIRFLHMESKIEVQIILHGRRSKLSGY